MTTLYLGFHAPAGGVKLIRLNKEHYLVELGDKIVPSHGSLTKAGKVRGQTPKIPPKPKRNLVPRIRNRREYWIRQRKAQGLPIPTVVPPSSVPSKKKAQAS